MVPLSTARLVAFGILFAAVVVIGLLLWMEKRAAETRPRQLDQVLQISESAAPTSAEMGA